MHVIGGCYSMSLLLVKGNLVKVPYTPIIMLCSSSIEFCHGERELLYIN
jgi:hypothetical protein